MSKEITLADTTALMTSDDYKERFKAEYLQTRIRHSKLHEIITEYENNTLGFELTCPIELLKAQYASMYNYLFFMEMRANFEGVDLTWQG